ncbi:hypothetical protein N8I74_01280 [Chitiniphilus purpureus]|uniref:Lipoyl-binding domain-containing protein n=1 Tax=Chitiniphilus purpureus TaxID=2981137 RepID=A0ABY6DMU3_9NEIS|nr:biotin/lipoyl-containing protein [Chitiniphilus sp. CD1]UXY15674.1 hypothetical protein N8I74_01280 [Chitiniphilus sp. CD1]
MKQTTTHLICAPTLPTPAGVSAFHVSTGQAVEAEAPLLSLALDDGQQVVVPAPGAGLVGSFAVTLGDTVNSDELLLMMEIEEPDNDWLALVDGLPAACAAAPVATPIISGEILQVTRFAAQLALRLGVDLTEVPPNQSGIIDQEALEGWVRRQLSNRNVMR